MNTLTGLDVLVRDGFGALSGRHIGLVTNHTGLTRDYKTTIDVMHMQAPSDLVALFGPEHGIRGELDEKVKDSVDKATNLPVYSLYGETMRPKPEQLAGLDTLVFDIQDIGCRFYTFISTLGNCMEAAASQNIRFVVLDRPNPVGGVVVDGPLGDADKLSFIAWHPMSVRHGMTVGELATLFKAERKLNLDLEVVWCENWRRGDYWDATALGWTNPSPNMRSLTQAILYPGIGLLETTNVSVGRGTDTPFEVVGAPWLDGVRYAAELNAANLPGVRFIPVRFTPASSVHKGARCGGVNIVLTNRDRFGAVRTGFEMAATLRRLYPKDWNAKGYERLLVNKVIQEAMLKGASGAEMERLSRAGLETFKRTRSRYLHYS